VPTRAAFEELLDHLADAATRIRDDAERLGKLSGMWRRGYVSQARGAGGGADVVLTSPERIATSPQPDRDIADFIRAVERWAAQGIELEKRRACLLPMTQDAALKLVDGDVGLCRAHRRAGIKTPLLRNDGARGDLCRWCYDFRFAWKVDPTPEIIRRKHEYGRISRQFVEAELSKRKAGRKRRRR